MDMNKSIHLILDLDRLYLIFRFVLRSQFFATMSSINCSFVETILIIFFELTKFIQIEEQNISNIKKTL